MLPQSRTVGSLTLERKTGTDGVVDTWRATWQADGDRPVLARKLVDWVVRDADVLSAVEARIGDLRELRHPRLVRILDYLRHDDERYIIEEAVRGIDLMTLVQEVHTLGGSMPPNVLLHVAIQLCTNLEALHHNRGAVTGEDPMLHRALRPSAVYVSLEGSVRLGGYGLLPSPNLIPPNVFRGPVQERTAFLAPEQVDDGREISKATDIFSLGAILYTMLTGEVLFAAPSDLQAVWMIRQADVEPQIAETRRQLPGIDRVLNRCLYAKPGRRYQSVTTLREDLRGLSGQYDMSRITDDILDLLAAVGLEPPSRTTQTAVPRPVLADVAQEEEDVADEPTAQDGDRTIEEEVTADITMTDPSLTRPAARVSLPGVGGMSAVGVASGVSTSSSHGHNHHGQNHHGHNHHGHNHGHGSGLAPPPLGLGLIGVDSDELDEMDPDALEQVADDDGFTESSYVPQERPRPAPVVTLPPPSARVARIELDLDMPPAPERTARSSIVIQETTGRMSALPPAPPTFVPPNPTPTPTVSPPLLPPTQPPLDGTMDETPVNELPAARILVMMGAFVLVAIFVGYTISLVLRPEAEPVSPPPKAVVSVNPPAVEPPKTQPTTAPIPAPEVPVAAPSVAAVDPIAAVDAIPAAPPVTAPVTRPPDGPLRVDPATVTEPIPAVQPKTPTRPTEQPVLATVDPTRLVTPPPAPVPDAEWAPPKRLADVEGVGERAARGKLTTGDRELLEGIDINHPDFTKARMWLYDDATARNVLSERKRHIEALMRLPENTYNPVYLTEAAGVSIAYKDYETALARARKAELHWARLPSQAVFSRKAMIYEQQAAAWYGLYVQSDGADAEALGQAIRAWQRYKQHVGTRDARLAARADEQITKLTDIQQRVQ
jgi:serine/threonine protein kinase